jgi:transposase
VVQFLRHLLRHLPGKILVIWDGGPIHRGQPIKDFLAQGAAKRVRVEQLPGDAPDLNPDEGIWAYLRGVELRNVCCTDLLISTGDYGWQRPASVTNTTWFVDALFICGYALCTSARRPF